MPGYQHLSRRDFVKVVTTFLGTVMGAVIGLPAVGYLLSPALKGQKADAWVPLGPLENYPPDVPTPFSFTRAQVHGWEKTVNSYGGFVLRQGDQVLALSNICPHLACRVTWHTEQELYICPCHDAAFYADGSIKVAPTDHPMEAYETKVEEGVLFIRFVEG